MMQFPRIRRVLRPRNIVIGLAIGVPSLMYLAFAKNADGSPRQARYWQVRAYGLFPLRAFSRLWGAVNSIDLPVWFRPYGYRFYSWVFGVDVNEAADQNLSHYRNLGEFFYRALRPGVRPIASSLLVSPSDGKVLQYGQIQDGGHIEQVKGVDYTVERFLGTPREPPHLLGPVKDEDNNEGTSNKEEPERKDEVTLPRHGKFAEMNGVEYTVDEIVGSPKEKPMHEVDLKKIGDAADSTKGLLDTPTWVPDTSPDHRLFYCVIYLAPGDYHRFHSPAPWIVKLRRHFNGELFSVAPYFQNRVTDLFCLNERVALLGKWKYGFFSMTPVGATNVGSIVINFDKYLKTNVKGARKNTCYEASYASASIAGGFPLQKGEEIGGFRLGSTVVLVFEAPHDFKFLVKQGDVVKMGQALGDVSIRKR